MKIIDMATYRFEFKHDNGKEWRRMPKTVTLYIPGQDEMAAKCVRFARMRHMNPATIACRVVNVDTGEIVAFRASDASDKAPLEGTELALKLHAIALGTGYHEKALLSARQHPKSTVFDRHVIRRYLSDENNRHDADALRDLANRIAQA